MQTPPIHPVSDIEGLRLERKRFQAGAHAPNTQAAYQDDFQTFRKWCEKCGREALPATPDTASLFLTFLLSRGNKVTTAARRARGIAWTHQSQGYASPIDAAARTLLNGARRIRLEQPRQMRPLSAEQIRAMAAHYADQPGWFAARNRAIIVTGFASALRRWNLAALDVSDLIFSPEGVQLRIRREKQDQEGRGRVVSLPRTGDPLTCPVLTLERWLRVRGTHDGPLFPNHSKKRIGTDRIWVVVKQAVRSIGADERCYGPHSLRSGFIVAAGQNGVNHLVIANHTGHRSIVTLQRYFRPEDPWKGNAASMVGL